MLKKTKVNKGEAQHKEFICLHEKDNVLVCIRPVQAGELVCIGELKLSVQSDISVGHKISRNDIAHGEKIIKSGAPIGSATRNIHKGQHVHTHNMRSDYILSHSRGSKINTGPEQ